MHLCNEEIAKLFEKLADLLEIEGENPFRIRAYRNAVRLIRSLHEDLSDSVGEGKDLTTLPGIGLALAEKIQTIVSMGKLPLLEKVQKRVPEVLSDLMQIEGLGPKRIHLLQEKLQIKRAKDLENAIAHGKIRELEGFGVKTEALIKTGLARIGAHKARIRVDEAKETVDSLLAFLQQVVPINALSVAGSYRRRCESAGDIDIVATSAKRGPVIAHFTHYEEVQEIISQGTTRASVRLYSGVQVDFCVVAPESFGAALYYLTGSKAHNIAVRKIAVKKGLKLNEYGVFKGAKRLAGKTEVDVFKRLGMDYIPPELREDRGEIEAAQAGKLPKLITLKRIKGDLHCHTSATDGRNSMEEMVVAAIARGYEYLAITDHSQRLSFINGLDKKRLRAQIRAIDRLNAKYPEIELLKGIEVDILEDGSLDLPNDILKALDLRVCSIHHRFNCSREEQTERIIRAMDNPYFNILGHPTGRLINRRDPYDVDIERVMRAAKERGCYLELNTRPKRMDLCDIHCKMAKGMGLKISMSTDSHSVVQMSSMEYGIGQGRRGWLEPKDVLNAHKLPKLMKLLARD